MSKVVRVDTEAEAEIAAAMDWHESEREGLGAEFLNEVRLAMQSLQTPGPECTPVKGVPKALGVKRKLVDRFPYVIIFVEFDAAVRVIAVAHGHRRPGYWRRRV
jgi:toxin ParE1/3/4